MPQRRQLVLGPAGERRQGGALGAVRGAAPALGGADRPEALAAHVLRIATSVIYIKLYYSTKGLGNSIVLPREKPWPWNCLLLLGLCTLHFGNYLRSEKYFFKVRMYSTLQSRYGMCVQGTVIKAQPMLRVLFAKPHIDV